MFSLSSFGALMTEIVVLYFWAVSIISLNDLGIRSDLIFTGHDWHIHSFAMLLVIAGFCCAPCRIISFATHAQLGLSGSGRHHLLSHLTLMDSYRILILGAPMPPSFLGRIALSQAICPFLPFQMNRQMFLSIVRIVLWLIPFTVIR